MTLYRTYRPTLFREVVGQETVTTTLQRALAQGRVSHAYLFTGPRGTGKTSTARILTRALCCLTPVQSKRPFSFEACGTCASCKALLEEHTTDFIEIDAASNRGIEDIRELREQVNYRPLQLSRKVYLIDEVHMLTGDAFNALLKTLEEPPEHCLFILATTELHKVPLTIRSRCQTLRFETGSIGSISQKLTHILEQEKWEVEPEAISLIAQYADGGFRDAETLLESLSTQHSPLTAAAVSETLGIIPSQLLEQVLDLLLKQNEQLTVNALHSKEFTRLGSFERVIAQLLTGVRSRIAEEILSLHHRGILRYAMEQLLEAYILQRSSPLPDLTLEIACRNICTFEKVDVGEKVFTDPVKVAAPREITPLPVTEIIVAKEVLQPVEQASVPVIELREETVKDIRKAWRLMIERVCQVNMVLGQTLKDTVVHTITDTTVTVHVRFKFHADKLQEKKNSALIHSTLKELTGFDLQVNYETTAMTPKRTPSKGISDGLSDAVAVFGKPS
jgi:DNA polymerase-3 subunit gamma/tau